MRKVVVKLPPVLSCSVEANLKPTIAFYAGALSLDTQGVAEFICSVPARLSCSLTKRLEPRYARVLEAGIVVDSTVMGYVAIKTDVAFGEWLEKKGVMAVKGRPRLRGAGRGVEEEAPPARVDHGRPPCASAQ